MRTNALYYGDNLVWLRNHDDFPTESVDLIYLDPPFNSNADYNIIFKEPTGEESEAQLRVFDDTWRWDCEASELALNQLSTNSPEIVEFISWLGKRRDKRSRSMAAYLGMMAIRLLELRRVLKSTGSIFLHCDSTAGHYLKVLMDTIFGTTNFRNEIIWKRTSAHSDSQRFGQVTDTILFYSKTSKHTWNPKPIAHDEDYTSAFYRFTDIKGRYRLHEIIRTASMGARPNLVYEYKGYTPKWGWRMERDKLEALDTEGRLVWAKSGRPYRKTYLTAGRFPTNLWTDITNVSSQAKERLGYPTQKPELLLERIIDSASKEGDIVLDPFCGCGTTLVVAHNEKRLWIGIDITYLSIYLVERRLQDTFGEKIRGAYKIYGDPYDVASAQALWNKKAKEFEIWALKLVGATPRPRDGGVDGTLGFREKDPKVQTIVVQVKGGASLAPSIVRDLIGTVKKEGAAIGLLISLHDPTAGMQEDAIHEGYYTSALWEKSYARIQIRTVKDILVDGKQFDLPPLQPSSLKQATRVKEQIYTKPML
jgi:site-specific DNA-methyltransferase (adenine-specific)